MGHSKGLARGQTNNRHDPGKRIGAERGLGSRMGKTIWTEPAFEYSYNVREAGGLDTARGLMIGLAISQVLWIAIACLVL